MSAPRSLSGLRGYDVSYKPVSDSRRERIGELIAVQRRSIALAQTYIDSLEQELVRGTWVSDIDFSSLPMPEPNCYICKLSTSINTCSKGYTYGVVCEHYVHFTESKK